MLAYLARHAGGESYAAIAADYNVSKVAVWNAVNGRSWRHLTGLAPRGQTTILGVLGVSG